MTSSRKNIFVFLPIFVFTSLLCVWWGFSQGVRYGGTLESVAFANISTAQIKRLQTGDPKEIEKVTSLLDSYVSHGIDQFHWYAENGYQLIGDLYYDGYEGSLVKSMKNIAKFRVENPEEDFSGALSGEIKEEYIERYTNRKILVEVISDK